MFSATDVSTLGQRELDLISPFFSNPNLRGLIISRGDKVLYQRVITEFPVALYTRESQRIDFPAGGYVYIAPFYADPWMFAGLEFNLVAIEGPYPDHHVREVLDRVRRYEGDDIDPQLYYAGQPRIAY